MGFWDNLGSSIRRGGMDEYTYERYSQKSNSELVQLARIHDLNALKMLKLRIKDDEEIKRMMKRGH